MAGAEKKTLAERVKPLVVNAIDDDEVFLVHQAKGGSDFVHAGERGDLIAEGFLHDGARKRKENGSVRRLHENIRAHSFDALAPFVYDAGRESNDHQDKNDLNRNGKNAQDGAKRSRREISDDHAERRKLRVVRIAHENLSRKTL